MTLNVRNRLARWTGQAGDAAGAREQMAVLEPIRERVLGPDHPSIHRFTAVTPIVLSRLVSIAFGMPHGCSSYAGSYASRQGLAAGGFLVDGPSCLF